MGAMPSMILDAGEYGSRIGSPREPSGMTAEKYCQPQRVRYLAAACYDASRIEDSMAEKSDPNFKVVADNRKARFNYEIGDVFEAGIALTGTEVKSLRQGKANIAESYAAAREGELWLYNANIPEYLQASRFNHAPKRPRKLLLHRREIGKLIGAVEREGMTVVPLKLYFNAKGRKAHDKREHEKEKDWKREQGRLMRQHG